MAEQFAMSHGEPVRRPREKTEPTPAIPTEIAPAAEPLPPAMDSTVPLPIVPPPPAAMPPVLSEPVLPPPPPAPGVAPAGPLSSTSPPVRPEFQPKNTVAAYPVTNQPLAAPAIANQSIMSIPAPAAPTVPPPPLPGSAPPLATSPVPAGTRPAVPSKPLLEWRMSPAAPSSNLTAVPSPRADATLPIETRAHLGAQNTTPISRPQFALPPVETRANFTQPSRSVGINTIDIPVGRDAVIPDNRGVQHSWFVGEPAAERPTQATWTAGTSMPLPQPAIVAPPAMPREYLPAPDPMLRLPQPTNAQRLPPPPAAN